MKTLKNREQKLQSDRKYWKQVKAVQYYAQVLTYNEVWSQGAFLDRKNEITSLIVQAPMTF